MSLADLAAPITQALQARGLQLDLFTVPGGLLQFVCPHGWTAAWKEDHVSVYHGVPPKGWLTIYPAPLREQINAEILLGAYLDEFVAPAAEDLHMLQTGHLERSPDLEIAEFKLRLTGKTYQGVALAWVGTAQGRVVSYWVEEALFRRPLVEDLLIAVLGSIQAPEGSRFSERSIQYPEILEEALWRPSGLELKSAFGSQAGRFAVRLPEGWRGIEVSYEGTEGWMLAPPGETPGEEGASLISISGADLLSSLEETLEAALGGLVDREVYSLEHPVREIDVRDQQGLVQLRIGRPPGRPGEAWRLWSLGMTDGASIVHFFALAEANRMAAMLPALTAIGESLRVLPRVKNVELMGQMTGFWRYLDSQDKGAEVVETSLHLREDGSFGAAERNISPRESITNLPDVPAATGGRQDGTWEIVDRTLSLNRPDGTREIFEIESVSSRSAIVGGTFWERL